MRGPIYQDRIERKFQVGISEAGVAGLWLDLNDYLSQYGLDPIYEITSVGSVYFDNKDHDLLRCCLSNRLMLFRLRAYEAYGRPPEPITEYWVEVKKACDERRVKKRFRLSRNGLRAFLRGKPPGGSFVDDVNDSENQHLVCNFYRESQETLLELDLKPTLLVTYKRMAFQNDVERLSIDWDVQYYRATESVLGYSSWKQLVERPNGKANRIILELKYLQGDIPAWFSGLERRFPIFEKDYLKPIEGMGFLFTGPLKHHTEAKSFLRKIDEHMAMTKPLG